MWLPPWSSWDSRSRVGEGLEIHWSGHPAPQGSGPLLTFLLSWSKLLSSTSNRLAAGRENQSVKAARPVCPGGPTLHNARKWGGNQ